MSQSTCYGTVEIIAGEPRTLAVRAVEGGELLADFTIYMGLVNDFGKNLASISEANGITRGMMAGGEPGFTGRFTAADTAQLRNLSTAKLAVQLRVGEDIIKQGYWTVKPVTNLIP